METFTKVNGRMILFMVMENIFVKMDIYMRANGIKGKNKAKEIKFGKMVKHMLDNLKMV
jgi:hypothetical protein